MSGGIKLKLQGLAHCLVKLSHGSSWINIELMPPKEEINEPYVFHTTLDLCTSSAKPLQGKRFYLETNESHV